MQRLLGRCVGAVAEASIKLALDTALTVKTPHYWQSKAQTICAAVVVAVLASCGSKEAARTAEIIPNAPVAHVSPSFAYENEQEWKLYSAVILTGSTGLRTTVVLGDDKLEVRQVEKDDDCASVVADVWLKGQPPRDDRNLEAFKICPISDAPSALGGEKFLMRVVSTDLAFNPISKPIGMGVDLIKSETNSNIVSMVADAMVMEDGSHPGRSTFTVWRDFGGRLVLADYMVPKNRPKR